MKFGTGSSASGGGEYLFQPTAPLRSETPGHKQTGLPHSSRGSVLQCLSCPEPPADGGFLTMACARNPSRSNTPFQLFSSIQRHRARGVTDHAFLRLPSTQTASSRGMNATTVGISGRFLKAGRRTHSRGCGVDKARAHDFQSTPPERVRVRSDRGASRPAIDGRLYAATMR